MPAAPRVRLRCPHAKPEDTCSLPPGVRYCVCYGDQHREPIGEVSVRGGQIFWTITANGKPRGWYSYVATVRQGGMLVPIELVDEPALREHVDNNRAWYVVRGPRDQRYEIEAAALIYAANDGREIVEAVASVVH